MRGSEHAELRAFAAIVEHGSFARAAAHLGVSASALSQTIRNMEERLGIRLLHRTTRSVRPSEAGEKFLTRLLPALTALDVAVAELVAARDVPSGTLRINSLRLAAIHYLGPLIGPFLAAYPDITMDIVVDERLVDIVAEGFDAGVRLGEKLEMDMVAVKLSGDLEMMVVATPDYLQRFGTPLTPRDLLQHRCLNYRWPTDGSLYRWEFERDGGQLQIAVNGPLMVNEPGMMPRIVADGAGIAYLFAHDIKDMVASGQLVQLLPEWTPTFPGFYLYYPSRRQMAPALRAFLDFIAANGSMARPVTSAV
ncbi:LysR family transcriptional regulator [Phyllobacterium myrsinacearum]|uniref:DNA-binding transcriptional LysR family regulator n=1 Tax=Phyllobacterium myrsinacearum TaxID=28101 RepID=A0A839EJE9_9HYPH|nr:LysR family transcriptional regulator [Phyllobacterium myrsinacearum]MBA8877654.1 DNA-binding transcriptional LysR family regulator [Phyllobacterium myrsinacearum]